MTEPIEKDCEGCDRTISWYRASGRRMSEAEYDRARFHSQSCAAIACAGNRQGTSNDRGRKYIMPDTPIDNFIYGRLL